MVMFSTLQQPVNPRLDAACNRLSISHWNAYWTGFNGRTLNRDPRCARHFIHRVVHILFIYIHSGNWVCLAIFP